MKLDIISDIHLTCFRDFGGDWVAGYQPESETLILAGDVGEFHWWQLSFFILETLCAKYKNVLFVPGNHEYYGTTFEEANERFWDIDHKIANFHYLNGRKVTVTDFLEKTPRDVTFAGATLWFPYDPMNPVYARFLSDFQLIRGFVPKVYDVNREHVEFLTHCNADVVITHHMPSYQSVHDKYRNDHLNRFFVCNVEEIMWRSQPKLWVHGHTHERFDYTIDKTRVVCHPLGYPRENSGPYGPLTVEV